MVNVLKKRCVITLTVFGAETVEFDKTDVDLCDVLTIGLAV